MNFSNADIWIMVISGAVGYVLRKFGYEMAPLLLALVLGDRLEENFRLALTMSGGSYATFADQRLGYRADYPRSACLVIQALAWAFGYRKSIADEAEGAMNRMRRWLRLLSTYRRYVASRSARSLPVKLA